VTDSQVPPFSVIAAAVTGTSALLDAWTVSGWVAKTGDPLNSWYPNRNKLGETVSCGNAEIVKVTGIVTGELTAWFEVNVTVPL
jgi:hypothetical protein